MPVSAAARHSHVARSSQSLLAYGARSPQVARTQQQIRNAGIEVGPIDGIFGPKTLAGVKAYQASRGLTVDGMVGPQTLAALGRGASQTSRPTAPVDGGDTFTPGGSRQVTAYVNGQSRSISVVPVGNGAYLRADAARAWQRMQDAARADGINLSATSGFRTMAEQEALYAQYGSPRAARPGYSNHQNGIAMDIGGVGGRGTAADRWLLANGSRFGFRNLPSEFWHYDFVG